MNLEDVNGIIVWRDGTPHPFGVNRMVPPVDLTDENYHTTSFLKDIYPTDWFQETRYSYRKDISFGRQLGDLAAYGFTVLCNTSSKISDQDDYYCFMINAPVNLTDNTRDYLESVYGYLKELIEKHHAFFQGTIYERNGEYAGPPVFDIDNFYEQLGLEKGKSVNRI